MLVPDSKFGKYEIREVIGKGGMGVVYRALDPKLGRTVALKLINDDFARLPDYRSRFAEEAKNAARIDSEHVVRIWEYDDASSTPFIAFEYVPGQDLRQATGPLTLEGRLKIAGQLADGLKAAHDCGVIHRDIKPENVRVTDSGLVKILDFGLAKSVAADSVDERGQVKGTLHYMSPEQTTGDELSPASDAFSLGVVLYEILTGRKPFEGEYPAAIIYSILHEDPLTPSEINPELPAWVDSLLVGLLAKDPAARLTDMRRVAEVIESALGGREPDAAITDVAARKKVATVTRMSNLSGDVSWDYFCSGCTEEIIRELSRRTDLIVSAEPESVGHSEVKDVFAKCRSDYVVTGSIMKWQDDLRMGLSIYAQGGNKLIFGEQFEGHTQRLFDLLARVAQSAAAALTAETGALPHGIDEGLIADVSAYDFYLRGKSYYPSNKQKDLEHAAAMFQKAIDLDPTLAAAHTGLADVYASQYMAYYDRTPERIKAAGEQARIALELDPGLPDAHRALGRYHMFTGDYARAEECFETCTRIDPKYALGHRTLAWLKASQGKLDEALSSAKLSHHLAPTDLETLLLISLIYISRLKYTSAMATLQRAVELGPDYGRAYYNLGIVYTKLGVFDLALENLTLAIEYKGDPNVYIETGWVSILIGDYERAEKLLSTSIEAGLLEFIAQYYLGLLKTLAGDEEGARQWYETSLASARSLQAEDPHNEDVLSFIALNEAACGNRGEALEILTKLAISAPENGDVLRNIARCYARLKDWDKAREYMDQSIGRMSGYTAKEIAADPHFAGLPAER